ncbi:MAG: agmatinase [Bacteroidetes bacterium]|jgi:guanidinobutyrase|nr:agmatinase [Bacteroidota bacterium]
MSENNSGFPQPLGGNDMPRFAGPGTMMRLPAVDSAAALDAVFIGIPMDIGTSNRPGTRFGPKQIRAESVMLRPYNMWTGAAPFDQLRVGDLGDVPINTFDLKDSVRRITEFYNGVLQHNVIPLTLGGDHTLSLPVLRAIAAKHGPVGLIHVDAHADVNDHMFGEQIAHGTPFRRALEEELIDPHRTYQIGLRGTGYTAEDFDWARARGFTVVQAEELWHRSATPLIDQIRDELGEGPVYLSFDIDSLDPGFAPGTGTQEIGGLTPIQALEIIRGCRGLNLVGADLVEVSPPYDQNGATALLAANLLYEMLCVLPGVAYREKG